jgi:hypothetical protein
VTAKSADGSNSTEPSADAPVLLYCNLKSLNGSDLSYVVIFGVQDKLGITAFLKLDRDSFSTSPRQNASVFWVPNDPGSYTLTVFVIDDTSNPGILSNEQRFPVNVENATSRLTTISSYSIPSLKAYALNRINEDRKSFGLSPVVLSDNGAAQNQAEEVLKTRQISHWMTDGEKPYMVYTRFGGSDGMEQNVATATYSEFETCVGSPFQLCSKIDPYAQIDTLEHMMMYNDTACCEDGHRLNILDKHHTHVSIGIASSDYAFALVQNFENHYVSIDTPLTYDDQNIEVSGKLAGTTSLDSISIYYDDLPSPQIYDLNRNATSYTSGELVAGVVPQGYTTSDATTIQASHWVQYNQMVDIRFDISPILTKSGVYTIYVIAKDADGEQFPIVAYSIFLPNDFL